MWQSSRSSALEASFTSPQACFTELQSYLTELQSYLTELQRYSSVESLINYICVSIKLFKLPNF